MNEKETVQPLLNEDSNDEDNEEYFLQSTSGPYNIQEKIREANDELFDDYEEYKIIREQRVKFREDLVDYEPDIFSDDGYVQSPDVLSIISDYENDSPPIKEINYDNFEQRNVVPEHDNFENNSDNEINCLYKQNNIELYSAIKEELENCDKVIIEEIEDLNENTEDEIDEENLEDHVIEVIEIISDSFTDENENVSAKSIKNEVYSTKSKKKENFKNVRKQEEKINCRIHCMEKRELDLITNKFKTFKENIKCPPLKLNKRKCCINQQFKPKLPVYNGLISEYGLTKSQLEKKQKKKEKSIERKREKMVRINEEKKQKDLYNEEIFCAWLKSLKYRKQNNVDNNNKENEINKNAKVKQRPKTANYCNLSLAINKPKIKRPNTSPTKNCFTYKIILSV